MRELFNELAMTDQNARDILFIDEQNFDAAHFLLASTLMTAFRAFQTFESRGVPFASVTPEFIIEFAKKGEAALNDLAHQVSKQTVVDDSAKPRFD